MNERKINFDLSFNIPILMSIVGAVAAGSMWVATVNNKLDTLAVVVADQAATRVQIEDLRNQVLKNREETLENRRVITEGE